MTDPGREPTSVSSRPLCRRYALAIAEVTFVRVRDASDIREHPLFWVFGWLADGECEPLGLCIGAHALPPMLAGFKSRGLERVWHVEALGAESAQDAEVATLAIDRSFPGALSSSRPHMLPSAVVAASHVRDGLLRAVRRHGHFENEAAALDFFALALRRAEIRLDRERQMAKERPRLDSGARTATLAG
ncbi:MAG: hypothetical protein H7247_03750 [Polaromonas sp.]|nr:hypothetical protein [Gemmatimonadaceae bacterium]